MIPDTSNQTDNLQQIAKLLASSENTDETSGLPNQKKMLDCGALLLEHLNATRIQGGFAVVEILNIQRHYIFFGAEKNLAFWQALSTTLQENLPQQAYIGRISIGCAIHAWGQSLDQDFPNLLEKLSKTIRSFGLDARLSNNYIRIPLEVNIGYLIYPNDCGYEQEFSAITRYAALSATDFGLLDRQSRIRKFNRLLSDTVERNALIESSLISSILSGNFELYFQPIIDLLSGKVIGAEALSRWSSADLVPENTGAYINLIEQTRYIVEFTCQSFNKIIRFIVKNVDQLPKNFRIGFNLSQAVFRWDSTDIFTLFEQALSQYAELADHLSVEITESAYFDRCHADTIMGFLKYLKIKGVKISIDDFGSGFGALRLLASNIPDTVKIDKEITHEVCNKSLDSLFIKNLIYSATLSRFDIIAEGIEESQQEKIMMLHGIRYAQGNYYAPALSETELIKVITSRRIGNK